ncbi:hypothetical protein A3758_22135 [Oleiphilus sp. HI0118]|nr:hypothetical protein A3758_22135 [Oleiphilus sp. HI0118]
MTSAAPAWICAIMMPFGFSISHGIGLGFLAHTVLQLLTGKTAEIRPAVALVSVLYVAGIVFGVL